MTNRERLLTATGVSGGVSNRDILIAAMNGSGNVSNRDKLTAAMNSNSQRSNKAGNKITESSFPKPVTVSTAAPRTSYLGSSSVGSGVLSAAKNTAPVGRDDPGAPRSPQQPTSPKPLTGFAAGVQANNEGYRKLAEKPSFGNYVGRKFLGGAAESVEGTANAAGYWFQDMVKSGELQHNNALLHAATTAKDPETKAAWEKYLDNMGVGWQRAENITQRSTKAIANFGDRYVAETEDKFADADFGKVGNLMGDVAQGVGGMLARMPARFLPGLGSIVTFASAYGNAKQSAQKNGADEASASLYALGTATVELATEKMLGFVDVAGKGMLDDATKKLIDKLAKSEAGKAALNTILGAFGEGAEEFIAEHGQAYIDKLTTQMDERSWKEVRKDAWYNALVGGITSVLFGTADIVSGGNGKLPTAEDLEAITTQAAEETVSSIAGEVHKSKTNTDTAINDNPAEHTVAEQAVIEKYKASSDASLRSFIEKVRGLVNNDYKNKIRHVLNTETDRALIAAQELTGTDTSDYMQIIKGNTIQHIDKRHGIYGEADHSMANIDDFSRINFVLDNFTNARIIPITEADPDTKKLSGEWNNADGTPAPLVQYSMPINGTYYVVEAIPASKAKVMAVVSAYISPKTNRSTLNQELSLAENQPGNLTSKTVPEILRTSNPSIPQAKNEVNGVTAKGQFPLLYTERLLEHAKRDGNIYTQRLLQRELEKARREIHKARSKANGSRPTIYADRLSQYGELVDFEDKIDSDDLNADFENDANSDTMFAGAILGAYNDKNDPQGSKRDAHAEQYYSTLRNSNREDVVLRIAVNADVDIASVEKMYDHLIVNKYTLDEGYKSFDPDYDIAESLQRLREGKNILEHDRILIQHEAMEYDLMNKEGLSYKEAHDITNTVYNYQESLKMWQKNRR